MKNKIVATIILLTNLIVHGQVNADFTTGNSCLYESFCFTDLSTTDTCSIVSWYWDFSDGAQSTAQNPCHTYVSAGIYTVTLIAMNCNGEADTTYKMTTVDECTGVENDLTNYKYSIVINAYNKIATITINEIINNATVKLFNSSGQELKQLNNISRQQIQINCNDLAIGVYFIAILQDNRLIATLRLPISD